MIELNRIYNEDCLEGMKRIPDKSIDMILTDPPYGIKYKSNYRSKTRKFKMLENDDNDIRFEAYSEFLRILKDDSVCVVFASWKNIAYDIIELQKYFDIKNILVWWKHGGGMGDLKYSLSTDYEFAIICHNGKCKIRGKRDGSVWECTKLNPNKMVHPTQKPEDLIERIIEKWSDESDVILDPFLGSGTTVVACLNTNRQYIGFELDKDYYNIANERIKSHKEENKND
jgi:site-specific DNA-methyltransferase (adenine-specific)